MTRLERLNARLLRLKNKKQTLDERCKASTDVAEVRSLTEQLEDINADIADVEAEIAEEEQRAAADTADMEARTQTPPAGATQVNGNAATLASYQQTTPTQVRSEENILDSMEYRKAFMAYVQRSTPIPADLAKRVNEYRASLPAQFRAGDAIDTSDTGVAIPLTIMREVINTNRKKYGALYDRVRHTAIPGGVEYPIGDLQAEFHWITEDTVSPNQDIGKLGAISFRYNVAECRIAQTFLSYVLTVEAFEAEIIPAIAKAYRKLADIGIVKGTGNGQMLGIINDPRVTELSGHTITLTAADLSNWTAWKKKFFAKLEMGYEEGEFVFAKSTVNSYLETMADANNNPIFKQATGLVVGSGDAEYPAGEFYGRRINMVEPDILPDFDTADANDVFGIYFLPDEAYAINENYGFTIRRYFDERENKWITKALCVVDGKVLNPMGIYIFKKG